MEKEDINISNDFMQNDDDGPKIVIDSRKYKKYQTLLLFMM